MLSGLASTSGAQESKQFTYDALGRLTKVESGSGPNAAQSAEYDFDKAGNRTRVRVAAPARVLNGTFENPALPAYAYAPAAPNVVFSGTAGIAVHGDAWGFPTPWHGRQVVFLQSSGNAGSATMEATNLVVGRTYQFAFAVVRRPGSEANPVRVFVNNALVQTVTPSTDQNFVPFPTPSFVAGSQTATIRFEATSMAGDTSSGLDAVSIERLN